MHKQQYFGVVLFAISALLFNQPTLLLTVKLSSEDGNLFLGYKNLGNLLSHSNSLTLNRSIIRREIDLHLLFATLHSVCPRSSYRNFFDPQLMSKNPCFS